ncbi:hypothetical protein GC163_02890 [bacterium]|nr:hypothetical protein [bacterium]
MSGEYCTRLTCLGLLSFVILSGCDSSASRTAEAPVPMAAPLPADSSSGNSESRILTEPVEKRFQGITLTIPAGWEERPVASDMIQAEYRIAGEGGPARMTLSSAGGGIEANLERWQSQFQRSPNDPSPARETVMVDGREAVLIELQGTFTDGFSGKGPQPDSCMLGAIIPTGPANFFLKLTGPKSSVIPQREAFRQLLTSAQLD